MCGIVGVINGSKAVKARLGSIFNDMLWADQLRGTDGAGVFWFDSRKDSYSTLKDEDINAVLDSKDYKSALSWIEHMPFMVGHNRSATRGSVKTENNHPFDEGNVVLVHNGTMTHIPKEYDDGTHVDSHAIAKMIHQASPQEFMKKSFGAYALVWFDKVSRQLNILRNSQRPLFLVHFKEFTLISSEGMLAAWCASRNGYGYERIEEVKEHTLYQYNPFNLTPTITDLSALKSFPETRRAYTHPYNLLDEDDDGYGEYGEYSGWWSKNCEYLGYTKPTTNVVPIVSPKQSKMEEKKVAFGKLNPWKYFDAMHKVTAQADTTSLVFRRGDWVEFTIDGGQEHQRFTNFVGILVNPNTDNYCVRGNVHLTIDQVMDIEGPWKAQIAEIRSRHGKVTLYVKDSKPVNEYHPEVAEKQQ